MPTVIVKKSTDLRTRIAAWRSAGERIAFAPTMGALHAGHISLVEMAKKQADRVVVSIFVNPMQFGPKEDLSRYPRPLEADMAKLEAAGVDMVFLPEVEEMYPAGFNTVISVKGLSERLCGPVRPGHFDGVATVVAKLLNLVMPDIAIFGQKDYQQLQIIRRLVTDLNLPIEILGAPVVREADALAMSSRNLYLTPEERQAAPAIFRVMQEMAVRITSAGGQVAAAESWGREELLGAGFSRVDYAEAVDAQTLEKLDMLNRPARIVVAAVIGKTRLIDNLAV